jgi:MFS family permease
VTSARASATEVRHAYANQVAISYSFYVVGAATAFVAVALALSDTEAGLHSSAMAAGLIVAGLWGERLDRLVGVRRAHLAAMGVLVVSLVVLALAPMLAVTLAASLGIGLGAGTMFGHVNQTLGAGGGTVARVQLTRGALIAKASQLLVPVAIGAGIAVGLDWRFVVVPVVVLVGLLFTTTRSNGERAPLAHPRPGRLPWAYWLPWILVVSVISIEFFVVVWGGTLVGLRTGVSLADATLTISAFIAGMIAGRAVISVPAMARLDPMLVVRSGIALTLVAVLVVWLTGEYPVAALAMLISGFGVGILYPPAASVALNAAPQLPDAASSRLVLAAGLAVLVAPLVLGVIADLSDITTAWLLVPVVCVGVLLLTVAVGQTRVVQDAAAG